MHKIFLLVFACSFFSVQGQDIDVLHYSFVLNLSDQNDTIRCTTSIKFVHLDNKEKISFDLKNQDKSGKGMLVRNVSFLDLNAPSFLFYQENEKLYFTLPYAKKGDTQTVRISYYGVPGDGLIISKNKYGDRTFFADNWPNRAHHWIPCIDSPNDKASFEFGVSAPPEYNVISNGIKQTERLLANGSKMTYWKEDIPSSTKVMVIGAAKFATKTYDNSPVGIPVSAWVYPQDSTKGFYDFALAPDILKFFSDYVAPFPYNKLANVQSKTIFGGMENASAIFYAENLVTGERSGESTIAHEIAHQWFGDMASEKSFAHLWLSEGFATYLTNYYFEKKYGKEVAAKRWEKDREKVIAFSKQSSSPVVDSTKDLMSLLNANSYQKGAWVLHMLSNEVGENVFQKIIQTYYNQYKGSNAETRDFEAVAEKISGKELTWFFDQWLYKSAIPNLNVKWQHIDSVLLITPYVNNRGAGYKLRSEFLFVYKDGRTEKHKLEFLAGGQISYPINSKEKPLKVLLDPETNLLYEGTISEKK